jgi:sugar lactone lactonase YvrE
MRRRGPRATWLMGWVGVLTAITFWLAMPSLAHAADYSADPTPVLELTRFSFGGTTYRMTPTGVAIDAAGNIYVGDSANACIVKFSPSGALMAVWGSNFDEDGPMVDSPHGMVFDAAGYLYVANYPNDVVKIDPTGHEADFYTDPQCAGIRPLICCVTDVALGPNGRLYASSDDYNVHVLDPKDYYAGTVFAETAFEGFGIAVDEQGRVYASDHDGAAIVRYLASGALDPAWGADGAVRSGSTDGTNPALARPAQLRLDAQGRLLAVDDGSNAVAVLDPSGRHVGHWPQAPGSSSRISPALSGPVGLALGVGRVAVADTGNERVVVYRLDAQGAGAGGAIADGGSATIRSNSVRLRYPGAFVLSGVLDPGRVGDACVVYVRKPGSRRWSYSSARLAYAVADGGGAKWWYRYSPRLRGTYSFYMKFSGDADAPVATSRIVSVNVR